MILLCLNCLLGLSEPHIVVLYFFELSQAVADLYGVNFILFELSTVILKFAELSQAPGELYAG